MDLNDKGWSKLAKAIINRAKRDLSKNTKDCTEEDRISAKYFMKSEWYEYLKYLSDYKHHNDSIQQMLISSKNLSN